MTPADIDRVTAATDRLAPRCPLCQSRLVGDPLSYAVHGSQGYRSKCSRCGARVVMAWSPLARALHRLGVTL